jgi:hypothetical protein
MAKTAEGRVKNDVKKLLDKYGAWHYWPVVTGYGKRTLDCLACHRGRAFAVETKRGDLEMTPLQAEHAAEMRAAGMAVFRVNAVDGLDQLEEWLNAS